VPLFLRSQRAVALEREGKERTINAVALSFGVQREAIECHAPLVGLRCSGRSGKTRGALLKWLEVCERKPGELSCFIALTMKQARRIAWRQLKQLDRALDIGLKFNVNELTVTHPNGSVLHLFGANRDDLLDVLRGSPFAFVYFDEAAFFREGLLKTAIEDALLIRMMDLDGELWIGSTPGYVEAGYHYDVTDAGKPGWRVFCWNYFDNPHLPEYPREPDAEKRRALRLKAAVKIREQMGWTEDTPSYVRDWLGRYARDTEALVYAFDRQIHMVDSLPASWTTHRSRWRVVLGIDFGSTNATAWVLWAFEEHSPVCYGIFAKKVYGKSPGECADITKQIVEDYSPDVIVGDSAAKGYIDEHRTRCQIAVQGADKQGKRAHQISMNDAWRFSPSPHILLLRGACDEYASELERLGKDTRFKRVVGADGRVTAHPRHGEENPRGEKDLCDAGLYGWWRCWAWLEEITAKQLERDRLAKARLDADNQTHDETTHWKRPRGKPDAGYGDLSDGWRPRFGKTGQRW
jgi:hypothetical protein